MKTTSNATQFLGRESSTTISSFNSLASCYNDRGQFDEVRDILEANLEILRKGCHQESQLLLCMNNLASTYDNLGSMKKAENLYRDVHEREVVIYGESHGETLTSLNNLAYSYTRQSKYQDAEMMYKKALQLATHAFGFKHRKTLTIVDNYSDTLSALGKNHRISVPRFFRSWSPCLLANATK